MFIVCHLIMDGEPEQFYSATNVHIKSLISNHGHIFLFPVRKMAVFTDEIMFFLLASVNWPFLRMYFSFVCCISLKIAKFARF